MKQKLQISNKSLVEECRKGDKEALNLFYLRFAPRMLCVIHRYIRDERDAEDVLHDGFIVALTRLDSLRDADKVEIWLATIMKNLSLQFLQAQDMVTILNDIPEVEDTPDIDEILDFETLELLIGKLPPGYQKVFRLAILENKSHKEIGKLLGIAPNSSSSQLFHAKLMMRKLIKEYKLQAGLGCLLVICLLTSLFIRDNNSPALYNQEIKIADIIDDEIESNQDTVTSLNNAVPLNTMAKVMIAESGKKVESETHIDGETVACEDSIVSQDIPPLVMEENYYVYSDNDDIPDNMTGKSKSGKGWALNVGADPGLFSFNSTANDEMFASPGPDLNNPGVSDPENPDEKENMQRMIRKAGGYKDYRNVAHTNSLPVSVVFSASKSLGNIFSIETGLRYTYLQSSFVTAASKVECHWHYAGIPLKLNVKLFSSQRFKLYAGVGGAVDIPVYSNADVTTTSTAPDLCPGRFSSPVVWSLSGNLGMSFKLSKKLDIFLEPTLQYHFDQDYTVPNVWTDDKWVLSLPLGLRLNF